MAVASSLSHGGQYFLGRILIAAPAAASSVNAITLYRHQLVNCRRLVEGRSIHADLVRDGLDRDEFLASYVIHMYLRLGSLYDARQLLCQFDLDDAGLWTTMISAFAQRGQHREALDLFHAMQQCGVLPTRITFAAAVNLCVALGDAIQGRRIFDRATERGFGGDLVLANSLLNLYATAGGFLREAMDFFAVMESQDGISWTTLMKACNRERQWKISLRLFWQMQQDGSSRPDKTSFVVAISACSETLDLERGKSIHASFAGVNEIETDVAVASTLVNMYNKCGDLAQACRIFARIPEKSLVTWNIMIAAYIHHGFPTKSLQLLDQMQLEGIRPQKVTFINSLNGCSILGKLRPGKTIHSCAAEQRLIDRDVVLSTALITMYSKCGSVDEARKIFDSMAGDVKNTISWNAMLAGYAQNSRSSDAIQLFRSMDLEAQCDPNSTTFATLLDACGEIAALREGEAAHDRIIATGLSINLVLGTAIVRMYSKCGRIDRARELFDRIRDDRGKEEDVVLWTTMLGGYSDRGDHAAALELFREMRIKPDAIAFVAAVDACANAGSIRDGEEILARIRGCGCESDDRVGTALCYMFAQFGLLDRASQIFDRLESKSAISWNAMLGAMAAQGLAIEAMELFRRMLGEGSRPDEITFAAMLDCFVGQSSLGEGRFVHGLINESGRDRGVFLGTALLNMYGKCGSLADSIAIFANLSHRNTISWNALIAAHASNGRFLESLDLFQELQNEGFLANTITFQSVIAACGHAGLADRGCDYMVLMIEDHGIVPLPEHYGCMIDLLGRAGWLGEAEDLVLRTPQEERAFNGMALLSSCRTHGDFERGRRVAQMLMKIAPGRTGAYALLSNIYAGAR
ncbi:pentatricopeptide repeat-containing protein At2g39620 [Selaginella moellendorffii]|uniref:pentatricopeptide repeat-containing protein At2g39620 n=1 Tax=Selaginella moellendorffii TaxID=88036 RepID=UPI000D1CDAFD|nr:pentatricopeptide repeat-containing protein At2g39620 [Selaginella moellendorffii]|eukprot:XP_024520300.1 pentatricopeptide repeat-containing protein At2g39620 [Selaginella moellendorffii]